MIASIEQHPESCRGPVQPSIKHWSEKCASLENNRCPIDFHLLCQGFHTAFLVSHLGTDLIQLLLQPGDTALSVRNISLQEVRVILSARNAGCGIHWKKNMLWLTCVLFT